MIVTVLGVIKARRDYLLRRSRETGDPEFKYRADGLDEALSLLERYREGLPEVMTSAEAAAALGVAQRTILNWCLSGRLAYSRTVGGHIRVHRVAVEEVLRGCQPQVAEQS